MLRELSQSAIYNNRHSHTTNHNHNTTYVEHCLQ